MKPVADNRVHSVDALRGIASLAVCFHHLTGGNRSFLPDGPIKSIGSYGWLGVAVFFVISGFIIPFALHKAGYDLRHYGTFVLKRIVRLDPPYLATIALIIPLGYLAAQAPGFAGPPYHVTATQVALHLAYLNVFFGDNWLNPVFWTLAIEFQYYLLVGLLFPLIAHRDLRVRLGLFAGLGLAAALVPQGVFIFHWIFLFLMGMLVFQYQVGLVGRRGFWVALALLVAGTCYILGPLVSAVGVGAALTIAFVRVTNRVLVFLGAISYSLYLIHVPVGAKAVNLGVRFVTGMPAKLALLAAGLALSIAAAYVLYRFVEKPAQKWSSAIRYRKHLLVEPTPQTLGTPSPKA
jgi:peptidoglycan/LPS O-acetylase OafA/YrhL